MFNKSLALSLLAAVMVAPGAAFAGSQSQNSNVHTTQSGTAIDGSTSAQSSESLNVQQQIQKTRDRIGGYSGHYGGRYCSGSYNGQSQNSSAGTAQSGAAVGYSDNGQSSNTVNDQKQVASNSTTCH